MSNEAIIHRIRSLLAKTTANGCSEAEAMAAASKAAEMMDAHDIQSLDLQEKSVFTEIWRDNIKHDVLKRNLASIVAKYCGSSIMYYGTRMRMMGRDIDMVMAEWLFETLVTHVSKGLKDHMSGHHLDSSLSKTTRKNGFIVGAVRRLHERVDEMMKVRIVQSNALVLVKGTEAKAAMLAKIEEEGATVKEGRKNRSLKVNYSSYSAGEKCANTASLHKQVG